MADKERELNTVVQQKQEAEVNKPKPSPFVEANRDSSFTFTRSMLTGQTCAQTDIGEKESDGEKICASVSAETLNLTRARPQLANMNLSLLPSREASELLRTPKCTARPQQRPQLSPYPGPCALPGNANVSAFRSPSQIKQQQQQFSQLTIFYGGKVNTYNVTSDTAKAIMALASSGENPTTPPPIVVTSLAPATPLNSSLNPRDMMCCSPTPEALKCQPRLRSLQRFLEKRNDRLQSRAPYANANAPLRKD